VTKARIDHWGQPRQHQIVAFFNIRVLHYSFI